jgi:hypothetical protein
MSQKPLEELFLFLHFAICLASIGLVRLMAECEIGHATGLRNRLLSWSSARSKAASSLDGAKPWSVLLAEWFWGLSG